MKAVILAAGRGSRMGTLTDDRPKCMIEIAGKSLLSMQLAALRGAGINEIAIVRGYRGECFEDMGFALFDNPRWSETNMVRSLMAADAWLRQSPCVISYADIFYSAETVQALMKTQAPLAISYDPDWLALWSARFANPLEDAESFRLDSQGYLLDIGRKRASMEEIEGQYMGLLKFTPQGWEQTIGYLSALSEKEADRLDMTGLLQRLIQRGLKLRAVPCAGMWGEVDAPSDIACYERLLTQALPA